MRITKTTLAVAALLAGLSTLSSGRQRTAAQHATPAAVAACYDVAPSTASTPATVAGDVAGKATGSPIAGMDHAAMELDLAYIDMMIPHHLSIIALAEAALPELADERLQAIARTIVETQSSEVQELRGYRESFYGEAEPMPMDADTMAAMTELMPGMSGTKEEMAYQMDAEAQVAEFCAAANPELALIDLTIPHHQMAIEASETAAEEATHEEIRTFAARVIEDQQREIDTLQAIRADLTGEGTPAGA